MSSKMIIFDRPPMTSLWRSAVTMPVFEMTYTVSSGTLNSILYHTIPYHTIPYSNYGHIWCRF